MRLIRPFTVNDAALVATDVASAEAVWNSGTAYTVDQEVIVTGDVNHRVYKALQASTNKNPLTETTYWQDIGPTNRWAVFDKSIGTATSKATSFYYEVQVTGRADSICFFNVEATSIRVQVFVGSTEYFDQTYSMLANSGITDWYAYYFEDVRRLPDKTIIGLPLVLNPKVKFTVTNSGSTASAGAVVIGQQKYIGRTQFGSGVGISDSSVKTEDAFGGFTVLERPYKERGDFQVMVDNDFVDELRWLLGQYRATAIVIVGTDCYESTVIYGFVRDFNIALLHHNESQLNMEVIGLT